MHRRGVYSHMGHFNIYHQTSRMLDPRMASEVGEKGVIERSKADQVADDMLIPWRR